MTRQRVEIEETVMPDGDFVTIAQAAAQLGISERALRRVVGRNADRTEAERRQITRRTRTGTRTATVYPIDLLRELSQPVEGSLRAVDERETAKHPSDVPERPEKPIDGQERGKNTGTTPAERGQERRRTRRKGATVEALLRARIEELTTALDIERDAHKRAELLHLNTQGELQALRDRAARLEDQNAKLIAALPGRSGGGVSGNAPSVTREERPSDPYENTDPKPVGSPESVPAGREVETPVPARETVTEPKGEAVRRPWWRIWGR